MGAVTANGTTSAVGVREGPAGVMSLSKWEEAESRARKEG